MIWFTLLITLFIILWAVGFWRWLAMAVSFLAKPHLSERYRLMVLRGKVWLLKEIANEIGRAEREIAPKPLLPTTSGRSDCHD